MALVIEYVSHVCGFTDKGKKCVALRVRYREAGQSRDMSAPGEIRLYFEGGASKVSADQLRELGWDGSKGRALSGIGSRDCEGYWRTEVDENGVERTRLAIATLPPLREATEKEWSTVTGGAS